MNLFANSKRLLTTFCLLFSIATITHAQKFKYSIPGLDTLSTFIVAGGSSTVLPNGGAEVISSNTLSSFWQAIHQNGDNSPILDRFRASQFVSDLFAFYGVSSNGRWDLGLRVRYVRSRLDGSATSSPFRVFDGEKVDAERNAFFDPNSIINRSLSGLTGVGIRFRVMPSRSVPQLVVNGGYTLATVKEETEQRQLSADRDAIDIGATYYKELTPNTFYFFSANAEAFLSSPVNPVNTYTSSGSFFLIQRTSNNRFTFYPGLTYTIRFRPSELESNPSLIRESDFLFAFGGVQYAPNNNFNVFLVGGFPLISNVTNPQVEIVRASYSLFSLGFRVGI